MIQFAWPWIFLLLPLPWLVRRLLPPAEQSGGGALRVPFFRELSEMLARRSRERTASWQRRFFDYGLPLLIWLLLLGAAARPQWLGEPVSLPLSGRDLMLAVDLSESMRIPDLDSEGRQIDRLGVVKQVLSEFIARREGDRLGLILFGTRAYLQTPLTFDRETVQAMLDEAVISLAGKATAIGDAIGLAIKRLRERPEESRVLILLTDGANTAGEMEPRKAAELAAQAGIKIHTVGVGAEEVLIRDFFGTRRVNPSRDLDEATLKAVAETTGGQYFRARDREELARIYRVLDELEPVEVDEATFRPLKALYDWPLGAALLLTLLWLPWRFGFPSLKPPLK